MLLVPAAEAQKLKVGVMLPLHDINGDGRMEVVFVQADGDRDDRYVHGAPEFVAEIISKSSRKTDTIIKLNKYMKAGVREYWIVDPYNEAVTVYDFGSDIFPAHYTFDDTVPVGISGGDCSIDFRRIKDVLIRQFG